MYGQVEYDKDGNPKCEICGKYFKRIGGHLGHAHYITAREYKIEYGLDLNKGLCSKESSLKSRMAVFRNYDKCVNRNIIEKNDHLFTEGIRGKKYVSEQTKIVLRKQGYKKNQKRPAWFDKELNGSLEKLTGIIKGAKRYDEDVFQDVIEWSLINWYKWNRKCKLTTWLISVYFNYWKRKATKTNREVELTGIEKEDEEYEEIEFDMTRLTKLTETQKKIITLTADGKSDKQISEIIGETPMSIKSYRYKIRKKLRA